MIFDSRPAFARNRLGLYRDSDEDQDADAVETGGRATLCYWPSFRATRVATLTPLNPLAYFAMPRYSDSAMRWRYSEVSSLRSSVGLLTNEISARIDGMLAPIRTIKCAFFTPRSRTPELLKASPLCSACCTLLANSCDSAIFSFSAIFFTRSPNS